MVPTHYHNGEVMLFDSLWNDKLSPSLEEQLVRIYQLAIKDGGLLVTVVPGQQQEGCTDYRLFSVAFAYHTAVGDNLAVVVLLGVWDCIYQLQINGLVIIVNKAITLIL